MINKLKEYCGKIENKLIDLKENGIMNKDDKSLDNISRNSKLMVSHSIQNGMNESNINYKSMNNKSKDKTETL